MKLKIIQLIGWLERRLMTILYAKKKASQPPIFIIGAPRSGSTILYQTITNAFKVIYVNNFIAHRYQTFFLSFKRFAKKGEFNHGSFKSNLGVTEGEEAPNEAVYFWRQWFSKETDYHQSKDLSSLDKKEIKALITAVTNKFGRPIVFKTLAIGQQLDVINDIFPEALFIYMRRDRQFIAQSIYKARRKPNNIQDDWFSTKPKNLNTIKQLPSEEEQIASQIVQLEEQISKDLKLFFDGQSIEIHYEDLCTNSESELRKINHFFRQNGLKLKYNTPEIQPRKKNNEKISINRTVFSNLVNALKDIEEQVESGKLRI